MWPGWSGTHYIDQVGLNHRDPPASACGALELKKSPTVRVSVSLFNPRAGRGSRRWAEAGESTELIGR